MAKHLLIGLHQPEYRTLAFWVVILLLALGQISCTGPSPAGPPTAAVEPAPTVDLSPGPIPSLAAFAPGASPAPTTPTPASTAPAISDPKSPTPNPKPPARDGWHLTPNPRSPTPTPQPVPTPRQPAWVPAFPAGSAPFVVQGEPATGVVALTFDMGIADSGALPQVLETFRKEGVRTTFFVTGAWVKAQPNMLRALVADGHELANHTVTHPDLRKLNREEIVEEMEKTEALVQELVGRSTKPFMRPPFGAYDGRVMKVLGDLRYEVIYWSLDSTDWRPESTARSIAQRVSQRSDPGDIVVFHGYVPKTAEALPAIVVALKERGLKAGTVSDVLGRKR